jgi:hypothetical protein
MPASRRAWIALILVTLPGAVDLHGESPEPNPDEAVLRQAGVAVDGPALLTFFRQQTLSDDDQQQLATAVQRLGDRSFAVRRKAHAELIRAGRPALVFLRPALNDADPERRRQAEECVHSIESNSDTGLTSAAARLLALRQPEGACTVLLNFLPQVDDEILEEELLAALRVVGVRAGKADEALHAALLDRSPARRAAAALILGRLPAAERPVRLRQLLADGDARVRFRTAQGLLQGHDKDAVPALVDLLELGPLALAYRAEDVLGRIGGDDGPKVFLGGGGDEERRQCRGAWADWWKTHGPSLDLAALELEPRLRGLTLICCCDSYNQGKGKVWEVDQNGKTVWEINIANYPVDAVMVASDRVLIAEQSGMCVTERDLKGAVLWEHKVRENLVSCQRLPGGNTFYATYSQLVEVTRDHREVYNHPTRHGTIYSAAKLRNGHIVYLGSGGVLAEIDDKGREIKALKVDAAGAGLYKFEPLAGDRFLLGQHGVRKVVELDASGKAVWDCPLANANSATRLPGGSVLACSWQDKRVVEMNRSGKVTWELKLEGGPLRVQRR